MKYSRKQGLRKHIKNIHADKLPLNFGIVAINELINDDAVEIPKKLKMKKHKCDFCELKLFSFFPHIYAISFFFPTVKLFFCTLDAQNMNPQ